MAKIKYENTPPPTTLFETSGNRIRILHLIVVLNTREVSGNHTCALFSRGI